MENKKISLKEAIDNHLKNQPSEDKIITNAVGWYEPLKGLSMDDWSEELRSLSFPFHILKLPVDLVIDSVNGKDRYQDFEDIVKPFVDSLGLKTYFVKSISRSPKDILEWSQGGYEIKSHKDAYKALFGSIRTAEDFCMLSRLDKCEIVIRPFVNIPKQNEFRVMVYGKQIVGISQYFYEEVFSDYHRNSTIELIEENIRTFVKCFVIPNVKKNHFVVDVVAFPAKEPIMIELNPFGMSDPCLFESYANLDGSFKFR